MTPSQPVGAARPSLIDRGEIVAVLDEHGARELTERIKAAAEQVWALLLEAHERRAWAALGYATWESYVKAEFDMTRQRAYQLLDLGRVTRAIEAAAVTTTVDNAPAPVVSINEHQARKLKPHLDDVTTKVRERVADARDSEPAVPPERVREVVDGVVADALSEIKQRRQDDEELRALAEEFPPPPGFDADADRERGRTCQTLVGALRELRSLPPVPEMRALLRDYHRPSLDEHLGGAVAWLNEFADSWRCQE